jgi:DNA polymerase III epsilon subunit-like protein
MVADKMPFSGSELHKELKNIFSMENVLVAHNAGFDVEMLRRENLEIKNVIDTHKIVQQLDTEAKIPRYALQYLRYYFNLEVENAVAHDALGDVRVLEKLFDNLFDQMMLELNDEELVISKMIDISTKPIFVKKFNFGKYNGMLVGDVAMNDKGYLRWLLEQKVRARDNGEDNDENWIYTLEHYLK